MLVPSIIRNLEQLDLLLSQHVLLALQLDQLLLAHARILSIIDMTLLLFLDELLLLCLEFFVEEFEVLVLFRDGAL